MDHWIALEKVWKTTQFEEFPCACEELTRYADPLYKKMHVTDSHIDAHTYVIKYFAHAHFYNNWNSKFRMSISNS